MMAVDETLTPARLTDFLADDYPRLRLYMGETAFNTMARHCLAASEIPKARVLSRHLPDFLDLTKPFSRSPELSDLARLERAFHAALNAPEASIAQPPLHHIGLHPSVQRLQLRTNATSIWAALTAGELPPPPQGWTNRRSCWSGVRVRRHASGCWGAKRPQRLMQQRAAKQRIDQSTENFLRGWLEAEIISAVYELILLT